MLIRNLLQPIFLTECCDTDLWRTVISSLSAGPKSVCISQTVFTFSKSTGIFMENFK